MLTNKLSQNFISFLTLAAVFASFTVATNAQGAPNKLPRGDWTLSAGVYSGPGYESAPVDVFSVTTDAGRGLTVTQVELLNRTDQEVVAVKLRWYLKTDERILQEDVTSFLDVDLPARGKQSLAYPVVSFARLARALARDGQLRGNYRIEVTVAEVEYAGASARRARARGAERHIKTTLKRVAAQDTTPCQNQGCVYNSTRNSYICTGKPNTFCSIRPPGRPCTETRCGGPNTN